MLGYADNTHLKGFQGNDVVQLGDYFVKADFGAVTDCDSPDFNGKFLSNFRVSALFEMDSPV